MLLFWDLTENKTLLITSSLRDSSSDAVIFYMLKIINVLEINIKTCF